MLHRIAFCFVAVVALPSSSMGQLPSFDNTPFDPDTWRDTLENTPFDPRTWAETADDLTNPGATAYEMRAKYLRDRYRTTRGLNHTEKHYLRPWFGDIVDKVFVMWDVPLNDEIKVAGTTVAVSADAQTFGYRIYFRHRRTIGDPYQLITLAHELLHVWQYERYGKSLKQFGRAYMNGYFRNGADYFAIPLERYAYDFEIKFANWLGRNHPNRNYQEVIYRTGSPYQRRTARIPGRLVIPKQHYAVTSIDNRTRFNVTYSYRWGNNEWSTATIQPGRAKWHSWTYEGGQSSSPRFQVRFDYDLSSAQRYATYDLERYRTDQESVSTGRRYHFAASTRLDLFDSEN